MMKSSLLLLFSFIYITVAAQDKKPDLPIDDGTKLITYSKVMEMPGVTKDSLFAKALAWCNSYFTNPADVIREKDAESGKILCKARFKVMNPPDKKGLTTEGGVVQYSMNLLFKEGRYKIVLTEYNWKQASNYPVEKWMDTTNAFYKPEYAHYLQQVSDKSKEILSAFEKGMKMDNSKKKDDW